MSYSVDPGVAIGLPVGVDPGVKKIKKEEKRVDGKPSPCYTRTIEKRLKASYRIGGEKMKKIKELIFKIYFSIFYKKIENSFVTEEGEVIHFVDAERR